MSDRTHIGNRSGKHFPMKKVFCHVVGEMRWANPTTKDTHRCTACGQVHVVARDN